MGEVIYLKISISNKEPDFICKTIVINCVMSARIKTVYQKSFYLRDSFYVIITILFLCKGADFL